MNQDELQRVITTTRLLCDRLDFNAKISRGNLHRVVSDLADVALSNQLRIAVRLVLLELGIVQASSKGYTYFTAAVAKGKRRLKLPTYPVHESID